MIPTVVWHGSLGDSDALVSALNANCTCAYDVSGARLDCCSVHAMLNQQRTLDHLLFFRRYAYRLLAQEFVETAYP